MPGSFVTNFIFIFFYVLVHVAHGLIYKDLEALGIACPQRDRCNRYRNNTNYLERSCECDYACRTYKDCCIDVRKRPSRRTSSASNMICLNYGENIHAGVYAVSTCSNNWSGPREVNQKCEGSTDLSDPVGSAPVTSTSEAVTYKNRYCAECNNADMKSLMAFSMKLSCEGLDDMSEDQIMDQLSYNQQKKMWGVNRVDAARNPLFSECTILYDVPDYLNKSVRFCRANIISKCARDWTRQQVKRYCDEYMAVVFDNVRGYRNPHCAICNHKTISELSCTTDLLGKKKPFSLRLLIDINIRGKNKSKCPSGQTYDPYLKKCRKLSCAFPGYVIQNGKCVPSG